MRWLYLCAAALVLCSCTSSGPEALPGAQPSPALPTDSPAPPPQVGAAPPGPHGPPQALLLHWPIEESDTPQGGRLSPIDPATAHTIEGFEPLDVEIPADVVLAPDGHRAAASIIPARTQYGPDATLHVIDLSNWTMRPVSGVPAGFSRPGHILWHPDGTKFYAIEETCATAGGEGRCFEPWRHAIWAVDAEAATGRLLTTTDFWADSVRVAEDGSKLYVLAHRGSTCCGIDVEGNPFIVVVDTSSGALSSEIPLPGLLLGQRTEARPGMPPDWKWNVQRSPGFAVSPRGDRAYIAHSDDARITVVDFERARVVRTASFDPAHDLLHRLGTWLLGRLATRAEAKGGLTFRTQVEVSKDDRYLFVTGTRDEPCPDEQYAVCASRPLGLRVVETSSMEVVGTFEDVTDIALTPDGAWLGAIGYYYDAANPNPDGRPRYIGRGARIIDLTSLDAGRIHVSAVINDAAIFRTVSTSLDGRYFYFHSYSPVEEPESTQRYRTHVDVFDTSMRQVLGRDFSHSASRVIAAP